MTEDDRLYGLPDAEIMWDTPDEAYQHDIADTGVGDESPPWTIEEWTSVGPIAHVLAADAIIDDILDWFYDSAAPLNTNLDSLRSDAELLAAADTLRAAVAAKIDAATGGYRWADKHVANIIVTLDGDGRPVYDRRPR
jgi:ABC-type glycerol-3-phosphate transport system substrate-binding protein